MYKAVFSDFDGTLLTSDHKISPRTLAAIARLAERGVPFVPISARSPLGILPYWKQLQTNNVLVAFSGALILDHQLQPIYSVQIDATDMEKLNRVFKDFAHLAVNYYVNDDCFTNDLANPWVKLEAQFTKIPIEAAQTDKIYPAHKVQIIGEPHEIIHIEALLKEKFPHLSICRSHQSYLEVMNSAATKGNAVRFLEKYFGLKTEEVIAFGDNFNDLDMLEHAGLGVAMGNAPEEIKQAANRVTAGNNEDGLALILEEVFPA